MKHRNRRILQVTVFLVLLFFILSTVGLSLISLTYNEVQAPIDQDIVNEYNEEEEVMT